MAIRTIHYENEDKNAPSYFLLDEEEYMKKKFCCGKEKRYDTMSKTWVCVEGCDE